MTTKTRISLIAGNDDLPADVRAKASTFLDDIDEEAYDTRADAFIDAVEDATLAFWAEVAKAYPGANSGDLPLDADEEFAAAARRAIRAWISCDDDA